VDHNRKRLAAAGGFDWSVLHTAKQVHGARVAVVVEGVDKARVADTEADALVSVVPGAAVGVYTADCVPILYADDEGRVAAAHAGWRGTVKGVAQAAVEALVSVGAHRERIRAALGPSICARCFEVGEEVAEEFDKLTPDAVIRTQGQKPHIDLQLANKLLLLVAGLREDRIDAASPCTAHEPERFFSFRRDGANIGQQVSFVVSRA
jgi:YfiH family protein